MRVSASERVSEQGSSGCDGVSTGEPVGTASCLDTSWHDSLGQLDFFLHEYATILCDEQQHYKGGRGAAKGKGWAGNAGGIGPTARPATRDVDGSIIIE